MSAISSVSSCPQAFGDKSLKCLRLTANLVTQTCKALFYKIISISSWLCCCPGAAHYYDALAKYNIYAWDQFSTYWNYGDQIINFSVNTTKHVDEKLPEGGVEKDALRKVYGKKALDSWLEMDTRGLELDEKHLARRTMNEQGSCFGMSLEFNVKYLRGIARGMSSLDAVKYASYRYETGSTSTADLLQIFAEALPISDAKLIKTRYKALAAKVGLIAMKPSTFPSHDMNEPTAVFKEYLETLDDGAYTVSFTPGEGVGHGVSIIKSGNKYYYFNPDKATFAFNLKEIARAVKKEGKSTADASGCEITFVRDLLRPKM